MLPDNAGAGRLYRQVQTQWRYGPDGSPTGLDYTGVRSYMAAVRRDVVYEPADFAGMQIIELSHLAGLRERRARDGNTH